VPPRLGKKNFVCSPTEARNFNLKFKGAASGGRKKNQRPTILQKGKAGVNGPGSKPGRTGCLLKRNKKHNYDSDGEGANQKRVVGGGEGPVLRWGV